jgi:queuine tRNA-ribosyltransferase
MLDKAAAMKLGEFKVHKTAGNARRGTLMTDHGPIQTPVFMAYL